MRNPILRGALRSRWSVLWQKRVASHRCKLRRRFLASFLPVSRKNESDLLTLTNSYGMKCLYVVQRVAMFDRVLWIIDFDVREIRDFSLEIRLF